MADHNDKCAHTLCMCRKREDSDYCSAACEAANDSDVESIACDCGHDGCGQ